MYSSCLFCHHRLGANDEVEHCPVGSRLAFDAARGRLWVVCPRCVRWNLTPIEERWEAIEECERLFRTVRVRASTAEISLARARSGLTLVRVGQPVVRELAVWRYGQALAARMQRSTLFAGLGLAAAGAVVATGALGLVSLPSYAPLAGLLIHPSIAALIGLRGRFRPVRMRSPEGKVLEVFRADFDRMQLIPDADDRWALAFKHDYGLVTLHGDSATNALRPLLARINARGANPLAACAAADFTAAQGGAERLLVETARASARRAEGYEHVRREQEAGFTKMELSGPPNEGALHRLSLVERLALEMALNDEAERHAMEQELAPLAAAWREAEEIAAIADGLLVPPQVEAKLQSLKKMPNDDRR